MTKLIVLFVIGQLLFSTNARPAPQDLSQIDAFGPIDDNFDPFGPIDFKFNPSSFPDLRESRFDAFGTMDIYFDPFGPIDDSFDPSLFSDLRPSKFDAFGAIDNTTNDLFNPDIGNDVVLPKFYKDIIFSRSGGEYFDSSSSFDIYNDLVYGPDFLFKNDPYYLGGNIFGALFPFAADMSFDMLSFHPMIDFAQSLEDIDSYFGDESRDLFDYFGGTFDSQGDAGEFGGNLASFFSQIYDGPLDYITAA